MKQERPKILVIDDDPKVKWLLSEGLSNNFNFIAATSGSEGLQMISLERPDIVLLDIKMPEMDGAETLRRIRSEFGDVPVVVVTGFAESHLMEKALEYTPITLERKPVSPQGIVKTVRGVVHGIEPEGASR